MSTFQKRLKQAMAVQKMKAVDLSEKSGVGKADISNYLNGKYKAKQDKVHLLARALGVTDAWLTGTEDEFASEEAGVFGIPGILPITRKRVPLLGSIQCGEPTYADSDFESYVDTGAALHCDFALRAKGDSMTGARIHDGDIVFIRKQPTVNDGEIAAVILDDDATLKRVRFVPGGITMLLAENPRYAPIIIGGDDETRSVLILGKAVAFQADVR